MHTPEPAYAPSKMFLAKSSTWLSLVSISLAAVAGWFLLPSLPEPVMAVETEVETEESVTTPAPAQVHGDQPLMDEWNKDIKPMLEYYCYDCHGDGMSKGSLDLDEYPDLASMRKDPKVWEHILTRTDYHLMPPPEEEQPEAKERHQLVNWINKAIFPASTTDPGHSVMRRMNRIEYQNTIKDLLGITIPVRELLPPDDSSHGFDNNGSALSISPAHIDKYLRAAEKALDEAIVLGPMPPKVIHFKARDITGGGKRIGDGTFLYIRSSAHVTPKLRQAGSYRLVVTASASQAGPEATPLDIIVDKEQVANFEVKNELHAEKEFSVELDLPAGSTEITLDFPRDFYDPKHEDPKRRDRNLMIHRVRLEGPLGIKRQKPLAHRQIFIPRAPGQDDRAYARAVLQNFARRAFRRPPNREEIDHYLVLTEKIAQTENSISSGIKSTLQAMLVSPSFLFIAPDTAAAKSSQKPTPISEHALASRLSYFLWSTMPDEELLALADRQQLRQQLDAQITRMLQDPRSKQMVENFAGQWLELRSLAAITPNRKRFREYTPSLADAMRRETEMLADHILRGDRNLLEFLDADYSFINERLAEIYDIPGVSGDHFRRVSMAGTPRRGILGHASILTVTSQPNRTSPVLRGKFILENILDITPPPPPPELPQLEDARHKGKRMSVREQLELHRSKTACAGCHNLMDPIGFAFENYNAIGIYRETEKGEAIDTTGQLVTGEKLENAESLRQVILHGKRDEFLRCLTIKMMTYATGRGIGRLDRLHIDKVLSQLQKDDYSAHSLIRGIIHSVPFQQQRR